VNVRTWAKLPTRAIKSDLVLHQFMPGELGLSVAALKLYLVIAGHVANPRWGTGSDGYLGISYAQLCEWTSVSRSMISGSLARLPDLVDVRRGHGRATSRYCLHGFPPLPGVGWAKLPIGYLMSTNAFEVLGSRSRVDLAALKLYILLVTFRDNSSGKSRLSYEKIQQYAAIGRSDISKAISCLVALDLIAVRSGRDGFLDEPMPGRGHNVYLVHGLGRGTTPE
jgi:hypothetical protein